MSVNVEPRVVESGDDEFVTDAWQLKERIRKHEGVLKQRRGFFTQAYRRSTVHLFVTGDGTDEHLMGFAAVRRDGYILFLAVAPEFRNEGIGKQLIATVADEHGTVTCHARASNQNALEFYKHLGFDIERRIDGYYEDGGNAYYLRLGDDETLTDKLADFVRR